MRKTIILAMGLLQFILPFSVSDAIGGSDTILEFETMVGVSGPFLGAANPIREIPGGGAPWVLDEAEGELTSKGRLKIKVEGLIIPADFPNPAVAGRNPAPFFLAAVSCLTIDEIGDPAIVNVFTEERDTRMKGNPNNGDAVIRAKLDLPDPCIAPIVFVTSPTGAWFAASGN